MANATLVVVCIVALPKVTVTPQGLPVDYLTPAAGALHLLTPPFKGQVKLDTTTHPYLRGDLHFEHPGGPRTFLFPPRVESVTNLRSYSYSLDDRYCGGDTCGNYWAWHPAKVGPETVLKTSESGSR